MIFEQKDGQFGMVTIVILQNQYLRVMKVKTPLYRIENLTEVKYLIHFVKKPYIVSGMLFTMSAVLISLATFEYCWLKLR